MGLFGFFARTAPEALNVNATMIDVCWRVFVVGRTAYKRLVVGGRNARKILSNVSGSNSQFLNVVDCQFLAVDYECCRRPCISNSLALRFVLQLGSQCEQGCRRRVPSYT